MFDRIEDAIEWITSQRRNGHPFSRFQQLCHDLYDPQNGFFMIHVAGTDGKGSTVDYLRSLLMEYGYKVGTFTSPHYVVHQDRIRINDVNIDDASFLRILNENLDLFKKQQLSMFEMDYLIMCRYFREQKVDIAIVEVGLGGRLDPTNVVEDTKLSVITTIGFDHMDRLGDTLAQICKEKCGIIKDHSKVLIGRLDSECREIARKEAEKHSCIFYELGDYTDLGERRFLYEGNCYRLQSYARYQIHNASLALKALDIVSEELGFLPDPAISQRGLAKAMWHCRFEIVREDPTVILDGAHNIHGIEALAESIDAFSGRKCIVFSALNRKEYGKMIDLLKKHADQLVITTFPNGEAIDLKEFPFEKTDPDYRHAIDEAIGNYDVIVICGSLYFLSEVVLNYKFA